MRCGGVLQRLDRERPLNFTRYAIAMYETGEARIGTLEVTAGSDLRAQSYRGLIPVMNPVVPPADWMVMSALRDSENTFFDFEGTPQEDYSGGTSAGEVASWLRATRLFSSVTRDDDDDFEHAKNLNPTANRMVILFIDTNMIEATRVKGKGKHFICLRSRITKATSGDISFRFWTWGRPAEQVEAGLTEARFDNDYIEAIVAEF